MQQDKCSEIGVSIKRKQNTLTTPFENPMVIFEKLGCCGDLIWSSAGEIFYLEQ